MRGYLSKLLGLEGGVSRTNFREKGIVHQRIMASKN